MSQGINFKDPVDMLLVLDDDLVAGHYSLYPWQMQIMMDFAVESNGENPYQALVRAANGSGKDKYSIAPCLVWFCMKYPNAVGVVTSASGVQLDRQTNRYIEQLCRSANIKFGYEGWKINYRHYEFRADPTDEEVKSTIELFATDEPGRAEGWHPVSYNSQLAIFTSESKSVDDSIFQAFARCTGFTKRVDVSTPGLPMGHFFDRCSQASNTYTPGAGWLHSDVNRGWLQYHITAYDCPHISKDYIEQCANDYGGYSSALFKSMVLAEFGTTDEMVVIPYHLVWNAINKAKVKHYTEEFDQAGLDLAAGGDENVLVIRNGNKVLKVVGFRMEDTAKTVEHLERLFKDNRLNNEKSLIWGDAGGLGKPILDQLKNRGWHNIRYVLNQSEPRDKRVYLNRGVENWFHFRKLLENGEILLVNDERLKRQLSTRYYKQTETNKLQLESKLQARSKGHPSPDRADALVLAFSGYRSKFTTEGIELPMPAKKVDEQPIQPVFTIKEYAKRQSEGKDPYAGYYGNGNEQRRNITELQRLVKEHNDRIRSGQVTANT